MGQQIVKKFIHDDAVDGVKIKLLQNQAIRGVNSTGVDVEIFKINASNKPESMGGELAYVADVANRFLSNLTSPTAVNQILTPDVPATRRLGDINKSWGSVYATRYGATGSTLDLGLVSGTTGSNQVTVTNAANLIAGAILNFYVPSTGVKLAINSIAGNVITLSANLAADLSSVQAYALPAVSIRTENEVGAIPSGDTVIRSGTTVSGKSGNVQVATGASSSGGTTGDVNILAGTTSGSRGKVSIDGAYITMNGKEVQFVANASVPTSAVNKGQMDNAITSAQTTLQGEIDTVQANIDTVSGNLGAEVSRATAAEGVLQSNIDAEAARATGVENALQLSINALSSNLTWRPSVFLISEDPELKAAVEGDALTAILPFLDDEAPALTIADFAADQLLVAKNGASSKIMKVINDAGTLKVSFVGVEALAAGHVFMVANDLTDSPAAQENQSIWTFSGADMVKVGDIDWSLADGIDLSPSFSALAGTVVAGDSVQNAISKIVGNLVAEAARAVAAEGVLQTNIDAVASDLGDEIARAGTAEGALSGRITALESVSYVKGSKVLDGTDVSNGYLDLANTIRPSSLTLFVGRLALHETEDYTLSTAGSVTRITFVNSLAVGGDEAIEVGFKMFWKYQA